MKWMLTALLILPSLAWGFDQSHSDFSRLLKKHVRYQKHSSSVDYKALKTDQAELKKYLQSLASVSFAEFKKFSKDQQIAFLINSYNAFTLQLILDNHPVSSIKKIGGWFKSPWKMEFFELLGKKRSLDWIEHEVLRKDYDEPRIHFAVNCASIGCPRLRDEAYTAKVLDQQLENQTKIFLTDPSRNRLEGETLFLSKIFSWFAEDFTKGNSSVQKFVLPYIVEDVSRRKALAKKSLDLKFTSYDWDLNDL